MQVECETALGHGCIIVDTPLYMCATACVEGGVTTSNTNFVHISIGRCDMFSVKTFSGIGTITIKGGFRSHRHASNHLSKLDKNGTTSRLRVCHGITHIFVGRDV
jgi:hypothetical protein